MPKQHSPVDSPVESQRLDKWLWYCRVAKTRTLASTLVQNGKVRVNRERTQKPGYGIKVDDVVTIAVHGRIRVLRVRAPGSRRGPATEAAELYEDLSPPTQATTPADTGDGGSQAPAPCPPGGERPTKRERRAIDRLQNKDRT